jgi:hypothetical protein
MMRRVRFGSYLDHSVVPGLTVLVVVQNIIQSLCIFKDIMNTLKNGISNRSGRK